MRSAIGWRKLVLVESNSALYSDAYQYSQRSLIHFSVYFCAFLVRIDFLAKVNIFEKKLISRNDGEGAFRLHFDWIKNILSSQKSRTYVNKTIFARPWRQSLRNNHFLSAICRKLLVFSDINVSQGSVATYARCSGIFNMHLTANLRKNLPVKKFVNRLRFNRIMVMSLWSRFLAQTVHTSSLFHSN